MLDLIEVTDGVIDGLASRQDAIAALPSLFSAIIQAKKDVAAACTSCGHSAAARTRLHTQYAAVRSSIVAMSPDNLRALKSLLGARQLRLVAGRTHRGVPVMHTI